MWRGLLDVVFPPQCAACNGLGSGLCRLCVPIVPAVRLSVSGTDVAACGWYEGGLRSAILALKDGRRDVAEALGERIAPLIPRGSILVPVPTTAARKRVRGMDGVALVAQSAAYLARAQVVNGLSLSARDAQRGRNRGERLAAHDRFACDPTAVAGRSVLLVDDVCTTGATLRDCMRAIAAAGGATQGAVVAALTKTNARGPTFLGTGV